MLHEYNLCSSAWTSEQSFVSVYRVYSLSIDNILCGYVKYKIRRFKKDYLSINIRESLNVSLDILVLFDNMEG
jgi:hypothetical protein